MPGSGRSGAPRDDGSAEDYRAAPGDSPGTYDDWTVADLRHRARQLGLKGYSGKKKADLVAMLRGH